MTEIRWHGRGGLGAFTAARLLGCAVSLFEGKYALAFPSFGPERRGAPVFAFTRIDDKAITDRSEVVSCDCAVVLDDTLFGDPVKNGLKPGATVIINTTKDKSLFAIDGVQVVTVDATGLALEILGRPITNVPLLGALIALPDGIFWLPDALAEGGYYWRWLIEDSMPMLIAAAGGLGCLFGAHKLRTGRRLRKKIVNIVGDSQYMYIEDIAAAIPCSYDKCRKHLQNCSDAGVFGPDAYLDMKRRCLVVKGKAPETTAPKAPAKTQEAQAQTAKETAQTKDRYQKILDELRRVNDAIPDEEMSDKISRLEAVSAKIFEQAKTDPDKLPRMRKFMDYYLPTSLKLLQAYAELDSQGVEGENITESKRRIEQTMDTLVHAFETQLDQLFAADAMDISADIDVMQNMLRADGLTGDTPFKQ